MTFPDYEVVIPTYQRPDSVKVLLDQIFTVNYSKLPNKILVVDDYSNKEDVNALIRIREGLPPDRRSRVVLLLSNAHTGMYPSIRIGLGHVKTRLVVVCVDDIRLYLKNKSKAVCPAMTNPFVTLAYYLQQLIDAKDRGLASSVGAVFPFVLRWEAPSIVLTAERSIHSIPPGVPPFIANNKGGYNFKSLKSVKELFLYEVSMGHHYCFCLDLESYNSVGGFGVDFDPYPYGMDDLCLSMRMKGIALFVTHNSAVYHRSEGVDKPTGSLTNLFAIEGYLRKSVKRFEEKWENDFKVAQAGLINKNLIRIVSTDPSQI